MKKVAEYLKGNKNIIIIAALILILILAVALLNAGGGDESASGDGLRSQEELKLMKILSEIDGVGEAEVMITSDDGSVVGVVIVCEGANNIMVKSDVLNVVSTALNVDKNNIAVYAMN